MQYLFALEWDPREIRLMVASGRGRQVVIEQAFSIPCEFDPTAADAAEPMGRRIAAELDARGLGRGEAVVAVGRSSIELRQLQLPPAPDDDLPDMVRFQATREFNELDDKWLLDFVPIDGSAESPRTVLATAIGPAVLRQIESICEHAGLKMRRLLLRPCEAALLLADEASVPRGQAVLLVDPLGAEIDLTAVVDGKAVFLRTTRVGSDPPPVPTLLAEIRLTLAAASNQLGGRRIEAIVLCGQQQADRDLAEAIQKEMGIHVGHFDPLAGLKLGQALAESPPTRPSRFAPLTGMLLAELRPTQHAVDFLHPRRRAPAPDPRKKWIFGGACAAALVLVLLAWSQINHYLLASKVDALDKQSKDMDEPIAKANKLRANTADVAKWAADDVIWLDRIYALDQSFPPAENAILNQLTINVNSKGALMDLKVAVRREDDIKGLEDRVLAHGYEMDIKKSGEEQRPIPPYSYSFEASVQPAAVSGTGRLAGTHSPRGTGARTTANASSAEGAIP